MWPELGGRKVIRSWWPEALWSPVGPAITCEQGSLGVELLLPLLCPEKIKRPSKGTAVMRPV